MSWAPSAEYWGKKLERLRCAIAETEATAKRLTDPRQIEAHNSQAKHYRNELAKNEERFRSWRNKRQNIERGMSTRKATP